MFGNLLHSLLSILNIIFSSLTTTLSIHGFLLWIINLWSYITFRHLLPIFILNSPLKLNNSGNGEYENGSFKIRCSSLRIHHRLLCPHIPAQNGLAKRKYCHIDDVARTLSPIMFPLVIDSMPFPLLSISLTFFHLTNFGGPLHSLASLATILHI